MCDELTDAELAAPATNVSRRQFTALSGAALGAGLAGNAFAAPIAGLVESRVTVPTPYGVADGFFVHPTTGVHPGILLWPDIGGLRDAFKIIARRLAAQGYAVLAINQYYRSSPAPILTDFSQWRTPEGQAKLKPMIAAITPEGTTRDATACVAWLDRQRGVDKHRRIGSNGYCMGGPYAVRTAAAVPARVGAAATLHGADLVNDMPDSPHRLIARTHANFLFAIARNDDARAPGDKDALRDAAQAAQRPAEITVYDADHGWCVADSPTYNPVEAEKAWGRLLALYATL